MQTPVSSADAPPREPRPRTPLLDALAAHPLLSLTLAAIALRLLLMLGRGDYVAFDEGWYLLLGRNLWSGDGYTLSGLDHVALSPLFPILAGALDRVIDDAVWAGRIVAALAAGLLVVPCWSIFRRLGGREIALVGATFVAVMPSLAPFVVPYWIGWDLWVGAEPLLHLFLFTAIALFLRAWQDGGIGVALACGAAFGLAYLSRPEAIVLFAIVGLIALAAALRSLLATRARLWLVVAGSLAFVVVAAPYWIYLHDQLGRWAISGRGVQVVAPAPADGGPRGGAPSSGIERMLWQDDESYIWALYSLDASGTALASTYWGIPDADAPPTAEPEPDGLSGQEPEPASGASDDVVTVDARDAASSNERAAAIADRGADERRSAREPGFFADLSIYVRALGIVVPWFLWPIAILGVFAPRGGRRRRMEALFALPLAGTSVLVAVVVATDPRTQLFVAPLVAYYAARGTLAVAHALEVRMGSEMRRQVAVGLVAGTLAVLLLGISARRLYLSLAVGSPHHIVGAENAVVGDALDALAPADATVMSWHPAIALFADRDWRVLPHEPMDRIVRYARTQPNALVVLSVFYPPELLRSEEPHYLIVPVTADTPDAAVWSIEIPRPARTWALGTLRPQPSPRERRRSP
ncbi:MAG TPA: glycosyltransferase family 39 protein [Longimicrobiales bacterium]|nr:glycosyltransferase family 39 protein [Longimicrobiales bacterium]